MSIKSDIIARVLKEELDINITGREVTRRQYEPQRSEAEIKVALEALYEAAWAEGRECGIQDGFDIAAEDAAGESL